MAERPVVLAPKTRKTVVTQTCPVDIAREIERRWERRLRGVDTPPTLNDNHPAARRDNHPGDGLCPVCKGYASIAPNASEYCAKGLVRRHWLCRACGHEWVTELHVLA